MYNKDKITKFYSEIHYHPLQASHLLHWKELFDELSLLIATEISNRTLAATGIPLHAHTLKSLHEVTYKQHQLLNNNKETLSNFHQTIQEAIDKKSAENDYLTRSSIESLLQMHENLDNK